MTELGVEESIDEEVNISHACTDEADNYFARIIGRIEEIIVDENFMNLQSKFLEEYWREFDNEEENKLVYTDIFKKYISTIEKHLEEKLLISIKDFNMKHFEQELENKQNELDGEVFEILSTFSDFRAFKNMFLDYKAMKEGRVVDFSQDISISKYIEV
ncbi:ADP-ribosylation factor-like protein 2-binding protein [Anoplophora glabripennis]|uniref:ADP-ribosylation factor-like protein 2-binding protein n=1 Tax=Anoplophora glabripennis TaxID=217634 RepID=UPI00087439AB|nr:ADP-ribosylation factor-like protein 2-binding protein [Anoplophora glabripennis]